MKITTRSLLLIVIAISLLIGIGIGLLLSPNIISTVGIASPIVTVIAALIGVFTLLRSLIKDFLDSKKRGSLDYGELYVRKTTEEQESRTVRISTYLLEVVNKNENTVATDCKCFIYLKGLARLTAKWDISDEEFIPIAHTEFIRLFTEIDNKLVFFVNIHKSIKRPELELTNNTRNNEIHVQIQSTNAEFPSKWYSQTINHILQYSKIIT